MSAEDARNPLPKPGDDWDGPWGSIRAELHSAVTLSFVLEDGETYSYPARNLLRWVWKDGKPETLEILAGRDRVTIHGSGLRRLAEALDGGQLEKVRAETGASALADAQIRIQGLHIHALEV